MSENRCYLQNISNFRSKTVCQVSRSVDKPVDNLWISTKNLWISLWIKPPLIHKLRGLWITPPVIHRLSTGKADLSTILSTGQIRTQRTRNPFFHSFHRPYYYYYYFFN